MVSLSSVFSSSFSAHLYTSFLFKLEWQVLYTTHLIQKPRSIMMVFSNLNFVDAMGGRLILALAIVFFVNSSIPSDCISTSVFYPSSVCLNFCLYCNWILVMYHKRMFCCTGFFISPATLKRPYIVLVLSWFLSHWWIQIGFVVPLICIRITDRAALLWNFKFIMWVSQILALNHEFHLFTYLNYFL